MGAVQLPPGEFRYVKIYIDVYDKLTVFYFFIVVNNKWWKIY